MKLYNSLTRTKAEFEPLNPPFVGMYVCGPTVYGHSHLGHAKSYVSFDVLVRYLRAQGFKVRYVQNITDVGHLTDDADMGEDKLLKQARLEKLEPMEVAEKYTRSYFEDMDALNVLRPDISPRASGHVPEQIELARTLVDTGHAYGVDGNVYFSVESFPGYGKLSGRKIGELVAGARVEVDEGKRDPRDFALWKRADGGHILRWRSPWSWGYPGWHLECSAMSQRYIGDTLDIHAGGLENIFPHHESEIAQSEAATGKPFARFWLHNNMITVDGQKMGKSLGNFILLKDIFERFDPMVVRLYILRSHYRSPLDFSDEGLESAQSGYLRLVSTRARLASSPDLKERIAKAAKTIIGDKTPFLTALREKLKSESVIQAIQEPLKKFFDSLDDDLGTPGAVAALFDLARAGNLLLSQHHMQDERIGLAEIMDFLSEDILGITLTPVESSGQAVSSLCSILETTRDSLRAERNFKLADLIRNQLIDAGFVIHDLPDGTSEIRPK
jgi:cysteinyl-tRNA synthetase